MPLGYNDLKSVVRLPGTWDATYLAKWNGRENTGVRFDELVRTIGVTLNGFNNSLVSPDNYYSRFITRTTDMTAEYSTNSDSNTLQKLSEYTRADPIRGAFSGHMLPRHDFGGALGWTYMALRRGTQSRMERDVQALIQRSRNTWDKEILNRLFKATADTVGTTGVSVPFADGGTADSEYVPSAYGGESFASTHTHYARLTDDAAGRDQFAHDAVEHLREHGIMGPYELVIPDADINDWAALAGAGTYGVSFIRPERGVITMQNIAQRANINEEIYVGAIETRRGVLYVRPETRLPANYAGVFKPAGLDAPDNVLMVRYEEGYPLGLTLVAQIEHYPLQEAQAIFTFGVGVGNRLAGYLGYFAASGSYTSPSIS